MTRPVAEPGPIRDGMSRGDVAIGHTPRFYSDGSLTAYGRPRPGLPVQEPSAAASEPPLPAIYVARQHLGREIERLRDQADAGRRDLQGRYVFTASGSQISEPGTLAMRAELAAQVEAAAQEADRLAELDDHQAQVWARDHGAR
jgi:hypothetical protein